MKEDMIIVLWVVIGSLAICGLYCKSNYDVCKVYYPKISTLSCMMSTKTSVKAP